MEYDFSFLKEVSDIIKKYETENQKNNINILQITGKDHNEVVICRLLAFLLNPKEKHHCGENFLNLFLKEIDEPLVTTDELETLSVSTEFPAKKNRRIDIVIQSKNRFIPFEVKIYAADQKEQCVDYYDFSKDRYKADKIYYLTTDGHEPDESSKGAGKLVNGKNLKCISFKNEILNWLEACEKNCGNCDRLIYEIKIAVRKFCGLLENMEMTNEILETILESDDSFETAKAIYSVGKEIRGDVLWEEFCKSIDQGALGDRHQFPSASDEADNPEAISIYIKQDVIRINFYEQFNWIDINLFPINKEVSANIQEELRNNYPDFEYSEAGDDGFVINSVKDYFIGNSFDNPFDLYKLFTKQKNEIITKMQDFISIVYKAAETF